jgi:hypothetical protein
VNSRQVRGPPRYSEGMVGDAELVLLFTVLHVIALAVVTVLLVMFLRSDTTRLWSPPEDGEGGDGGGNDRLGPRIKPGPGGGGLPLPDAVPARVRLRDHTRLADLLPTPPRRPAREPGRTPRRVPQGRGSDPSVRRRGDRRIHWV